MDTEKFLYVYNESRNGANFFVRHPLARTFTFSDGVRDVAEAGCYWLLDILATELPAEFRKRPGEGFCTVRVDVEDSKAVLLGEWKDDDPTPWRKTIGYTDMPNGAWVFYVSDDGDNVLRCILPTEY